VPVAGAEPVFVEGSRLARPSHAELCDRRLPIVSGQSAFGAQRVFNELIKRASDFPRRFVVASGLKPGTFEILAQSGEIGFHFFSRYAPTAREALAQLNKQNRNSPARIRFKIAPPVLRTHILREALCR
jgi:hypothetical protein